MSKIDWNAELVKDAKSAAAMLSRDHDEATLAHDVMQDVTSRGHLAGQTWMAERDTHFRAVPVCAEGCSFCCHQAVMGTTPEIVAIADYLRESLDAAALETLRKRLVSVATRTRELTHRQWYAQHEPCPLLDVKAGACTVHEARPSMCRGANSLDVRACMDAFDAGNLDGQIPKSAYQEAAMQSAWLGSMAALAESGLDAEAYDVTQALAIALSDEDVALAWARGEKPLMAARVPRTIERSRGYSALYDPARLVLRKNAACATTPDGEAAVSPNAARNRARNKRKKQKK